MGKRAVTVSIVYCADCGYEEPTLRLMRHLMDEFHMYLARIEVIPAAGGQFEVSVDGELIHSALKTGRFPAHEAIADEVRRRIGE